MKQRFGQCLNFDLPCPLADKMQPIPAVRGATEFKCAECGKPIILQTPPSPPVRPWIVAGAVLVVLILAFFAWRHGAPNKPIAPSNPTPSVAATPEPTLTPMPNRTTTPTQRPSARPTPSPSPRPTPSPSPRPTPSPSARPTPSPSPRPTPSPSARPTPSPSPRPTLPPRTPGPRPTQGETLVPPKSSVEPTEPPSAVLPPVPTASPTLACAVPDVPASVLVLVRSRYPNSEIGSGEYPIVDVRVNIDEQGDVRHAVIEQTSGITDFDNAAMESAVRSSYRAPIVGCTARAGTYILHVDFSLTK
jgi:TonB family protein